MHESRISLDLVAAAKNDHHEKISTLLGMAKASDISSLKLAEPLSWAAHNGHIRAVKVLLDNGAKAEINFKDNQGNTALHWAAYNGHESIVTLLISYGADERVLNNNLLTPAKFASINSNPNLVSALKAINDMGQEADKLRARIRQLESYHHPIPSDDTNSYSQNESMNSSVRFFKN